MKQLDRWLPERFRKKSSLPEEAVAIYPMHTERRISSQRSCFTIHGADEQALDTLYHEGINCLAKITIPAWAVPEIRLELEGAGIDEVTIFPDLTGLGRTIAARWRLGSTHLPHEKVYTRLRRSEIHGVGVFAIVNIKKDTPLFEGADKEMPWFEEECLPKKPKEIRRLYEDFAVVDDEGRYGCPRTFDRLNPSWYLNQPRPGEKPNVHCDSETYEFCAARDIKAGEELTVDYATYSIDPPDKLGSVARPTTKVSRRLDPNGRRPK
jgi:hypothetical protein